MSPKWSSRSRDWIELMSLLIHWQCRRNDTENQGFHTSVLSVLWWFAICNNYDPHELWCQLWCLPVISCSFDSTGHRIVKHFAFLFFFQLCIIFVVRSRKGDTQLEQVRLKTVVWVICISTVTTVGQCFEALHIISIMTVTTETYYPRMNLTTTHSLIVYPYPYSLNCKEW